MARYGRQKSNMSPQYNAFIPMTIKTISMAEIKHEPSCVTRHIVCFLPARILAAVMRSYSNPSISDSFACCLILGVQAYCGKLDMQNTIRDYLKDFQKVLKTKLPQALAGHTLHKN